MIDATALHRQRMAIWRARGPAPLCTCGTCIRCRKRAWMRAARARRRALEVQFGRRAA